MKTIVAPLLAAATLALGVAAAPVTGVRSSGTLVVQTNLNGTPLDIGANVALYRKDARYRLDVLSLGFPGQDKTASAILGSQLLPQGGISIVYDGTTGSFIGYSNANRTYYSEDPKRASGNASTPAPAAAAAPNGDPLRALAAVSSALRDVRTASIQILGHPQVNGHPATDLDVKMERKQGGSLEDYHARLALADDLDGFPLQVAFQANPAPKGGSGGLTGALKLDLSNITAATPDDATFQIPSGYTRVNSISDLLRRSR